MTQATIFEAPPLYEAEFSPCRTYRYRWSTVASADGTGRLLFVLLNPSKADERRTDPTVRRCVERARRLGFRIVEVVNIFAYRSTDPKALKTLADPVGPWNDTVITAAASLSDMVIAGWGGNGKLHGRGDAVMDMLKRIKTIHCLRLSADGIPWHPLYLPYSLAPRRIS